jgi:hypothetical protein
VGGIVGGILGTLLLVSVGALCFLLERHRRLNIELTNQTSRYEAVEKAGEVRVILSGNLQNSDPVNSDIGGRLRYPNDDVVEGGRLGSSV